MKCLVAARGPRTFIFGQDEGSLFKHPLSMDLFRSIASWGEDGLKGSVFRATNVARGELLQDAIQPGACDDRILTSWGRCRAE